MSAEALERQALARLLYDNLDKVTLIPDGTPKVLIDTEGLADAILAAGFRRQGPITDAPIDDERAIAAWDLGAKWGAVEVTGDTSYYTRAWLVPSDNPFRPEGAR